MCIRDSIVTVENVDYGTGNLTFDGSVVVTGTVADGFRIDAGGHIQVDRYVGKAQLAAGGSILLRGGANGGGECRVQCDGDLLARYIENAEIRCKGDLFVEEVVMHTSVSVGGNLILSGRRAELFAGTCMVGGSIWCKKLGNVSEVKTTVRLGADPVKVELSTRLTQTIDEKREQLNELDARLVHLTEQIKSGRHITEEESESLKELNTEVKRRTGELAALKKKHRAVASQLSPDEDSILVVLSLIHI